MRAVQVTRNGPPAEVLAVRRWTGPMPGPGPGAGRGRRRLAQLQRHRPLPGQAGVGPHPAAVHPRHGRVRRGGRGRRGRRAWLGRRVVAITTTALGGIAEYALADAVSVFDAPDGLDDAEATAFLLPFQTSHLALFRRGRLHRRRDPGGALGGQRARHGRDPAGQGGRGPGDRRGRRAGQGRALCRRSAPTW